MAGWNKTPSLTVAPNKPYYVEVFNELKFVCTRK